MKIRCCVCGKDMGEKEPYEDKSITHTYCDKCSKEEMKKWQKKEKENKEKDS